MLLLYYIVLSILEFFMTFSMSCDHVTCNICDHLVTCVTIMYNVTLLLQT